MSKAVAEWGEVSGGTLGQRFKHVVVEVRQGWSPQCYPWPANGVETWGVLKAGAVNGGVFRATENKELPATEVPRPEISVRSGDLVISRANTRELLGSAAVVEGNYPRLMLCDKLYAFKLDPLRADSRYVALILGTRQWRGLIELESSGSSPSMQNISQSDILNLPMDLPSLAEQRAIVDYLDRETARIDTLIEEQQRLIELLQERRESVVDLVLARNGLSIPSRFEDYGSNVPHGWRLILLGRALQQLTNGFVGPTRDILVDDGIRYIQSTHIKLGRIDFERRPFYVSRDWHEARPRIHLRERDVLIVQTGDIGKVAAVPPGFGEASCHALQIARTHPHIVSGEYLAAFLSSRLGYQSLLARATGALHPHLEAGIRNTPIVVPPVDIQHSIVAETTEQTAKIDALIAETERFIALARERRAALITAAVTGQINVHGEAA